MKKLLATTSLSLGALAYASGSTPAPAATRAAAKPAADREEPKVAVGTIEGFTPPPKGRTVAAKYPFDSLEPGQYFSVLNKTHRQMASPINNANKRYRNEMTDATGAKATVQSREFYSREVDAALAAQLKGSAHEGAKVLVIRSK